MPETIIKFLLCWILPPGLIILIGLLIVLLMRGQRKYVVCTLTMLSLLYVCSLPITARLLEQSLYANIKPLSIDTLKQSDAQAYVLLGGGIYYQQAEYAGKNQLTSSSIARLHYLAWLYKHKQLPILISGGNFKGIGQSEAALLKHNAEKNYRLPIKWIEDKSNNTIENAKFSKEILTKHKVKRIILVTSANTMERAKKTFEQEGFSVQVAPTRLPNPFSTIDFRDFNPSAKAISHVNNALHELIGVRPLIKLLRF